MARGWVAAAAGLSVVAAAIAAPAVASASAGHARAVHVGRAGKPVVMHVKSAKSTAVKGGGKVSAAAKTSSPNMTFHGGVIMTSANIHPIFWGTSWATYTGDKITGVDTFYAGWNNSNYAKTTTEYTGTNGTVGATSTSSASVIDKTTASGGSNTTTILNEVSKEIAAGVVPLDTSGNGYYPVYTDLPRGSAAYCAWHSTGTVNGQRIQFAFFWKLDGDAGCDPADTTTGHSQGLAALANVSAHELAEAVTDPASPGAWYDSKGSENGDKCAWTYNVPNVTFSDGTKWKVQGEWSNAAYTAGTGYANSSAQKGCLDGH